MSTTSIFYNALSEFIYNALSEFIYNALGEFIYKALRELIYNGLSELIYKGLSELIYNGLREIIFVILSVSFRLITFKIGNDIKTLGTFYSASLFRTIATYPVAFFFLFQSLCKTEHALSFVSIRYSVFTVFLLNFGRRL